MKIGSPALASVPPCLQRMAIRRYERPHLPESSITGKLETASDVEINLLFLTLNFFSLSRAARMFFLLMFPGHVTRLFMLQL